MHVKVTVPRLILCSLIAVGITAAAVVLTSGSAPPVLRALRAATFTTVVPSGYTLLLTHPLAGFDSYQLTRGTGVAFGSSDVPAAGNVQLTLSEVPILVASSAAHDPRLATLGLPALLELVVKLPAGAEHAVTTARLHRADIGGQPAAAISYRYRYQGRDNAQSDIVTRRDGELVGVELDSEPVLAGQAAAAESTVLANWAWNSTVAAQP